MTLSPSEFVARKPSFVRLGPTELAYRRVGHGDPLLLVHGYPLSGLTFRNLIPTLAESFTCYVPDLPGAGDTRWTEQTDFQFTGQARTLRAFVDALGLTSYSVLAHDTGGTIARKMVIDDAPRLRCLILIGTEMPGHRPPWIEFFRRTGNPKRPGSMRFLMSTRWFRHWQPVFGGCFSDPSLIEGEFFDLFVAPLIASAERASGQIRYLGGLEWSVVDSMKTDHARIVAPTLLVWGEDDPIFPVAQARQMIPQFKNCKGLVAVPGAKLFVQEEKPSAVAKIALDFLASSAARAAE